MRRPRAYRPAPDEMAMEQRKLATGYKRRAKEIGLTEAHVQQTVTQFLELDGWRAFKMEAISESGFVARVMRKVNAHPLLRPFAAVIHAMMRACMRAAGVGEVGMPDYLYVRYANSNVTFGTDNGLRAMGDVLWIEFKAPGKAAKPHQQQWHDAERNRGALVLVVDDIDSFRQWYAESGLQRR